MLAVQVQYWSLQENKRHNLVTEQQGAKNLEIAQFSANEIARHNLVSEDIGYRNIELGYAQLAESSRHSRQTEQLSSVQNEIAQYNAETNRMNYYTQVRNSDIAEANALTNARNADINATRAANDYALGLINADLKQQQIDTDRRLADYTWYDVFNNKSTSAKASAESAHANTHNADSNAYNAETNRLNAETNQIAEQHRYEIDQGNLDLRQKELFEKAVSDAWRNYNDSIRTGADVYDSVINADR